MEIWKDIKDFEGIYQVSNLGRVKSCERVIDYGNRGQINNNNSISKKKKIY